MHRSRLGALVVDCQTDNLKNKAEFWSKTLVYPARFSVDPTNENVIRLDAPANDFQALTQTVTRLNSVHLDRETENRLVALLAWRKTSVKAI